MTAVRPAPGTRQDGCRSRKSCKEAGRPQGRGHGCEERLLSLKEAFLRGLTIPTLPPARRTERSSFRLKKMTFQVKLNDQQKQTTEEAKQKTTRKETS